MDLPAQIGRYQILERIAQGGMADVFLARTFGVEGFEKRLVVKRIRPALSRSPRLVAMFINEARIAVSLNHPNIVQVYELNRSDGDWFIAMEHIHGRDLTRIRRTFEAQDRLMPVPLAVYAVATALRGLGYAHGLSDGAGQPLGIVHGDISPHNVVVSFTGEVKVVDFGIARLAGKGAGEEVDRPGGGKFAYMSPEQVRGRELDQRSDVYSAGIVLYELLVGHRLFQHEDPEEKLRMVREAIVADPRVENPAVHDDLWAILQRALARDPADRYASAEAFERDLRSFLFHQRHQTDATALAACMREAFSHEALEDPAVGDLSRLADDLRLLELGLSDERDASQDAVDKPPRAGTATPSWVPAQSEELKDVAVLCVEVSDDTDLAVQVDPSSLMELERDRQRWFRKHARRFGGLLQSGAADTVTILFGVPRTRQDDLERALRCALSLRNDLSESDWNKAGSRICIGVNVGQAAVQHAGGNTVTQVVGRGSTVRLARRLASHGELGQVLVSPAVAQQAEDSFAFERSTPLPYRSRSERNGSECHILTGRLSGALGGHQGRWLVRGSELAVLREALVALARREGRFVLLQGEAGVGKSRLVREVSELARKRHLPVYNARAYPFSDTPLAPYRDLVASITGVTPRDDTRQIQAKLDLLGQLRMDQADIATLAWLFDLSTGTRPPSTYRDQLLEVTRRLMRALAHNGPVLIVFEDVHHMDKLELELLQQVVRVTRDRSLLLLATCDSDTAAGLQASASATIELAPLTQDTLAKLVAELLHAREIDPALASLIAADAAGNPKYVLEMLKALERSGFLERQGQRVGLKHDADAPSIPHTLRGLFAARIDELSPATKGVLQVGATIGMRIPQGLLEVCVGGRQAHEAVNELANKGIWRHKERTANPTLEFTSEAFWEVVGSSMLGGQLREAHRLVSDGMLRLYGDDLDPHRESLARHLLVAGEWVEATRHLGRAGDLHHRRAFLELALQCYEQALGIFAQQADTCGPHGGALAWNEISLHRRAGEVALLLGRIRRAERYLQVALEEASEHGFQQEEGATCLALGKVCMAVPRRLEARAYLDQARELADLLGDEDLAIASLESLGRLALDEGDAAESQLLYSQALARAGSGSSMAVRALLGLANLAIRDDRLDDAEGHLERARVLAEKLGDRILLGRSVNNLGIILHTRGDYAGALERFQQALTIRQGVGYRVGTVVNHHNIGDSHLRLGQSAHAYAAFQMSLQLALDSDWRPGVTMNTLFLGYLDAERGDESGLERLADAIRAARRTRDLSLVATGQWLQARWLARAGKRDQAHEAFSQAIDTAHRAGDSGLERELMAERNKELEA
jgi:serine/threonine protein kinase/tetratricopeptide (TPR) repeat protein